MSLEKPSVSIDFNPSPADWAAADEFFDKNPTAVKFDKWGGDRHPDKNKRTKLADFAFIQVMIDEKLERICMSNKTVCQRMEGGLAFVKKSKTRDGKLVAVRVTPEDLMDEMSDAYRAAKLTGLIKGQMVRKDPNMKFEHHHFKGGKTFTQRKRYTVMEWGGDDFTIIVPNILKSTQSNEEKIARLKLLALRAAQVLDAAHQAGILHGDIKTENFTAIRDEDDYIVRLIDFDFARITLAGDPVQLEQAKGTEGFAAPEIFTDQLLSANADNYSFAVMLGMLFGIGSSNWDVRNIFNVYNEFIKNSSSWEQYEFEQVLKLDTPVGKILYDILNYNPDKRPPLRKLIEQLREELLASPCISSIIKNKLKAPEEGMGGLEESNPSKKPKF